MPGSQSVCRPAGHGGGNCPSGVCSGSPDGSPSCATGGHSGDGARWIWKRADEPFPGAVQMVDEYHAREHVWKVARAAFAAEPERRDTWATPVRSSCLARVGFMRSSRPSSVCIHAPRNREKRRACRISKRSCFATMPIACHTRCFARKACIWAVALLKPPVKRWSALAQKSPACAGSLMVWPPFWLCVRLFSAAFLIGVGEPPLRGSRDLQFFPTPVR